MKLSVEVLHLEMHTERTLTDCRSLLMKSLNILRLVEEICGYMQCVPKLFELPLKWWSVLQLLESMALNAPFQLKIMY